MAVNSPKFTVLLLALFIFSMLAPAVFAEGQDYVCAAYFTKDGCPFCENAAPFLEEVKAKNPNLVILQYNLIDKDYNAPVFYQYTQTYGMQTAYPQIIFGKDNFILGDKPIISMLESRLALLSSNPCPLESGASVPFDKCNLSALPGKPEIFIGSEKLNTSNQCVLPPEKVHLTFAKLVPLALADAVNPCEFAILVLMLVTIIAANPGNKRAILLAGLAFSTAIFAMYLVYGFVIIKFIQVTKAIASVHTILYKLLAVVAIILGALNLKDFFHYKPGSFATEMPLSIRPAMKRMLGHATSPKGAFAVGLFVTLFLLPCTAGPYVIAGGLLSAMELLKTLPWLLLYNLIFISPMIAITLIVYFGLAKIENVSEWRDRHVKWMHLVAGLIMVGLGLAMLVGLI